MKIILIVLDSAGCGECEDSYKYGDRGANTLLHTVQNSHEDLGNLRRAGLFNIDTLSCDEYPREEDPLCSYGKMREKSQGKDTTTGHFELCGAVVENAYKTYENGLPQEMLDEFTRKTGCEILGGGLPASGTEIIQRLGEEHIKTGKPIVYTSADSVFQIAADEKTFGLARLYEICEPARRMLVGEWEISRVIARPFIKTANGMERTKNRKDYSVLPPSETILCELAGRGYDVIGVGKIEDIFSGQGITKSYHTTNNAGGMEKISELLDSGFNGLVFANLVDFDMLYGHRRDKAGYLAAIKAFNDFLPNLYREDVTMIITADHGCDPTHKGTDHTREFVPLLVYDNKVTPKNLGTLDGFDYIASYIKKVLADDPYPKRFE